MRHKIQVCFIFLTLSESMLIATFWACLLTGLQAGFSLVASLPEIAISSFPSRSGFRICGGWPMTKGDPQGHVRAPHCEGSSKESLWCCWLGPIETADWAAILTPPLWGIIIGIIVMLPIKAHGSNRLYAIIWTPPLWGIIIGIIVTLLVEARMGSRL